MMPVRYKDKSDAWRLLHSLAPRLDGRAWPERKRDRVMAFYELVSELQDVKLEAKFFDDVTLDADGKVGWLERVFWRERRESQWGRKEGQSNPQAALRAAFQV